MPAGTGFSGELARTLLAPRDDGSPVAFRRLDLPAPRVVPLDGRAYLVPAEGALRALAREAFLELGRFLPRGRLEALLAARAAASTEGERLVLDALAANAVTAAETGLPLCQDTGIASVHAARGERVLAASERGDEAELELGVADAWKAGGYRSSVVAPRNLFDETDTGDNLPAAVSVRPVTGEAYAFLFAAKGGGSSNKSSLRQETRALLEPEAFDAFLRGFVEGLGVAACPPYRLAIAIGGVSPEETLEAMKLAAAGALDALPAPDEGESPVGALRLRDAEARILELAAASAWGAQFGGSRLALDARVVRLPRHAASLHVATGVSCAAHRRAFARIDREGVFLEELERDPGAVLARAETDGSFNAARALPRLELSCPAAELSARVRALRSGQLVSVSGPLVLARDAAHARLAALLSRGVALPPWALGTAILYAGPSEPTPLAPAGALGPTTAKRMDGYLETLMAAGASLLTLGKGERTEACRSACSRHGGAYLAVPGGAAALFGARCVESVETLAWPELGMEAVRRVVVRDLPALVAVDARGVDAYARPR
ncbi:MAG: fumarate hydratase [Spirochaetales bacterium]|nr:fumarate hydratase [Spirochaetales bacterium]